MNILLKKLTKQVKKFDILDIKLMYLAMVFLTFFALLFINPLMNWLHGQDKWIMLIIAIILFARPCYKCWIK